MRQKLQTLLVGFCIIAAAAIQTEVSQRLKIRHMKAANQLVLTLNSANR